MDFSLTPEELATYEWQLAVPGFGAAQQEKLKAATVMVSRVGGVGGAAAMYLAAAGVGKLILAHGGRLELSDLNRQTLMKHAWIGRSRVECAAASLRELNPRLEVEALAEHITEANVVGLVAQADLVVDAAPRFDERLRLNRACVQLGKPMVESAMYELQLTVTTFIPGQTPCLACLHPETPPLWERKFPVLGAVAGVAGALAAMEAIKVLTDLGTPLAGRMFLQDLRDGSARTVELLRDPSCRECAAASPRF